MSVFAFDEFEAASRESTSETFDASLVVFKNQPGQLSVHGTFSYMCSGYRSEKFIPFGCAKLKQILQFWNAFNLEYIICCLFPQDLDTVYSRYPYQEGTIDEWFKPPPESGVPPIRNTVNILNMSKEKRRKNEYPLLNEEDFKSSLQGRDLVLFHGTSHESAKNILEKGIKLDKLDKTRPQDFSNGEGFYVSTDYQKCKDWTFDRNKQLQAILTFKLPQSVLVRFEKSSIDLKGDKKEWKNHVEKCRSGKIKGPLKKEIKRASYVEGPWAKFSGGQASGPHSHQICLLSGELAEEVDRHLDSVVFF